jgi:hypothetical protein
MSTAAAATTATATTGRRDHPGTDRPVAATALTATTVGHGGHGDTTEEER